jgi:hypothetical protein
MERRSHIRKPTDSNLTVYLYFAGRRIGQCSAHNLSVGGVFLKTELFDLAQDTPLDLLFTIDKSSSNIVRLYRIPAVVARSVDEGFGIRFCNQNKLSPPQYLKISSRHKSQDW